MSLKNPSQARPRNRPKINIQFDAKWLPYIAALVQASLYAMAGNVYFGNYFSGGILGVLPSLSMAFGSSRMASVSAKERKAEARFFRNSLLVISPAVVSPAIYQELKHLDYGHPVINVVVNILVSLLIATVPDFSIYYAGVIAGGSLMGLTNPPSEQSGSLTVASGSQSGASKSGASKKQGKSNKSKSLQVACPNGCSKMLSAERNQSGQFVPTTNAMNAHIKHCPNAKKP